MVKRAQDTGGKTAGATSWSCRSGSRGRRHRLPHQSKSSTGGSTGRWSYNRRCRELRQFCIIILKGSYMTIRPEDALEYHSAAPAGKVSVVPTKPCRTQRDFSLAYIPGVAVPCRETEGDPTLAYKYTSKDTLLFVISNGTGELGLGNNGARAGNSVMEGKGM